MKDTPRIQPRDQDWHLVSSTLRIENKIRKGSDEHGGAVVVYLQFDKAAKQSIVRARTGIDSVLQSNPPCNIVGVYVADRDTFDRRQLEQDILATARSAEFVRLK